MHRINTPHFFTIIFRLWSRANGITWYVSRKEGIRGECCHFFANSLGICLRLLDIDTVRLRQRIFGRITQLSWAISRHDRVSSG